MLVVRREQVLAMERVSTGRVIDRIGGLLRRDFGHVPVSLRQGPCRLSELDDAVLRDLVGRSVDAAIAIGFRGEADLAAFTVLRFVVAPNFHCQPPVVAVFGNPTIPVEARFDRLWRYTDDADWDRIGRACDPGAW